MRISSRQLPTRLHNKAQLAVQAFEQGLTRLFAEHLLEWHPEVSFDKAFSFVVNRVKSQAIERSQKLLEHNRELSKELLLERERVCSLLVEALLEANIDPAPLKPSDLNPLMTELLNVAKDVENFSRSYGPLYRVGKGSAGESGKGRVPLRAEQVSRRFLLTAGPKVKALAESLV